ncbi:MAG: hypothetical protein R3A51_13800 [Nannocystaceae bacterium]|nr:hypothetical protein [Myxococcales bacterium]
MNLAARILTVPLFLATVLLAGTATAASFRPFTDGGNVCEKCTEKTLDTITLKSGTVIKARVTAKNSSFYVLNRHGEVRALPIGEVKEIKWAKGSEPAGLTSGGQVVLKNGHVLSGQVSIESNGKKFIVRIEGAEKPVNAMADTAVAEVYINGQKK